MSGFSHEDIEQIAWTGVMRAAQKYDPTKTGFNGNLVTFPTYALFWTRASVMNAARWNTIGRGRPQKFRTISGDMVVGDGEGSLFNAAGIASTSDPDPAEPDRQAVLHDRVADVLKRVPERYRSIFKARYGLDDGQPKTLLETANLFGVTRERIRQIEAKVLNKIREPLRLATQDLLDAG